MLGWVAGVAAAAILAGQATPTGSPPVLEDPEGVLVEAVVVKARLPGPAWWRVSDADTTVYILGLPDAPLPPGVSWDRSVLQQRLRGANVLIERPSINITLRGAPALLRMRAQLRSKTPLEQTLPEDLRTRFVAARQRIGRPAGRYSGWTAIIAGERLVSDSQDRTGWAEPETEVSQAARALKVRRVSPGADGLPFMKAAVASITPAIQHQCLRGALDDAEALASGRAAAPARAWAEGRVAEALSTPRSLNRCLLLLAGGSEMWRAANRSHAQAVANALAQPGHAVAVAGLRPLLAKDGVLQTLRARGFTVLGPGDPVPAP